MGDTTIDSIRRKIPASADQWFREHGMAYHGFVGTSRQSGLGVVAHEIGHGLGDSHPDQYGSRAVDSVMGPTWAYPMVGLSEWERIQLLSPTGPGDARKSSTWLRDEVNMTLPPAAPEDLVVVSVDTPEGTVLKVDGQYLARQDGEVPFAFLAPERRKTTLEVDPQLAAGTVVTPVDLDKLARLGWWLRDRNGDLSFLGEDRLTEFTVQDGATLIYAPARDTPVAVRVDDQRADRSRPVSVHVDSEYRRLDGSGGGVRVAAHGPADQAGHHADQRPSSRGGRLVVREPQRRQAVPRDRHQRALGRTAGRPDRADGPGPCGWRAGLGQPDRGHTEPVYRPTFLVCVVWLLPANDHRRGIGDDPMAGEGQW
jgi:hypothetical protein